MINNNALQFKRRKGFRFLNTFQGLCLHIHTDTEKEKDVFHLIILFLSTGKNYWLSHTINYARLLKCRLFYNFMVFTVSLNYSVKQW